jgi:peptidoglycan-associated lipoprotein
VNKEWNMTYLTGTRLIGLVLVVGITPACATKAYVNKSVADVHNRLEGISRSMEETQERTRANESRIGAVDEKAAAAQSAADGARQAAGDADAHAERADSRATALDRASRRLVYSVVLSEDEGNFAFGRAALPAEAKSRIDEMVIQLKENPQAVYFEIEGHTDSVGPRDVNDRLGLERAEAVKRYLYDQHQIPLHKMNVISYGAGKPVAPNTTKTGRAANRRVVVKVLS